MNVKSDSQEKRIKRDLIGKKEMVPSILYGIQTQLAIANFYISGIHFSH
jgi:aspartate ammonia-lyase